MPKGKRNSNRPSAGGIKRNDYHRPNRKEGKGHRWKGAHVTNARLIKPAQQSPVIERTVYEDKGFSYEFEPEYEEPVSIESTLSRNPLIFYPPFLKRNEIRKRRFAEMEYKGEVFRTDDEMNDCWWEWEDELNITTRMPERL